MDRRERVLGQIASQPSFLSLINVSTLIAADHPIRPITRLCDEALRRMSGHFDEIYAKDGAPSNPPETLLKGKVLRALYTVRSERQLCVRLQADMLFRWFVDLSLEAEVFDASTYTARARCGCSRTRSPTCSSLKWPSLPAATAG